MQIGARGIPRAEKHPQRKESCEKRRQIQICERDDRDVISLISFLWNSRDRKGEWETRRAKLKRAISCACTRGKYTGEKFLGIKGTTAANTFKRPYFDRYYPWRTSGGGGRNELPDAANETGASLRRSLGVLLKEIDHQRRTKSRTAMPLIGVDTDLRVVPGLPEWNGARNFDPALNESAKIALLLQHNLPACRLWPHIRQFLVNFSPSRVTVANSYLSLVPINIISVIEIFMYFAQANCNNLRFNPPIGVS